MDETTPPTAPAVALADRWLKIHAPHLWTRALVDNLARLLDAVAPPLPEAPILAPPGEGGTPPDPVVDPARRASRR
jgi:hypothetical protein